MEKEKSDIERQFVIFAIGKEEFGVNINQVREIIRLDDITKIPNTEEYVRGVINIRGSIIVIIDLAMKLGLPKRDEDHNTRILVVELQNSIVGMIVDSATEVLRLYDDQLKEAPQIIKDKIDSNYLEGVGVVDQRLLILLDLEKVVSGKTIEHIEKVKDSYRSAESKSQEKQEATEEITN